MAEVFLVALLGLATTSSSIVGAALGLYVPLSKRLLANKVAALESGLPDVVATANIGCLSHIQSGTRRPVRHWIELLDEALA